MRYSISSDLKVSHCVFLCVIQSTTKFHSVIMCNLVYHLISLHHCRSNRSGGRGGYRDANAEESRESGINSSSSNNREGDRDLEGRYGALYEQRMNPFAEVIYCCHIISCHIITSHVITRHVKSCHV